MGDSIGKLFSTPKVGVDNSGGEPTTLSKALMGGLSGGLKSIPGGGAPPTGGQSTNFDIPNPSLPDSFYQQPDYLNQAKKRPSALYGSGY